MNGKRIALAGLLGWLGLAAATISTGAAQTTAGEGTTVKKADAVQIRIGNFQPEQPVFRAKRPMTVSAVITSTDTAAPNTAATEAQPKLIAPAGVKVTAADGGAAFKLGGPEPKKLSWQVVADEAKQYDLRLEITRDGVALASATLALPFLPPAEIKKLPYIPEPAPVKTSILVGAHNCPLWEAEKPEMWANILKHPERTPALGFYDGANPEVSDWETKWAVEHGVDFFIYCWYRTSQGGPVKTMYSSAIHDGLFKSKFASKMKFTIMWENQRRGFAGVADEKDLMTNLLPFWIETYFKNPSYLKVDGKPVLFIYRPEFLVDDLGGPEKVAQAFDKMRQACRDAGFAGLTILGEYRGLDPGALKLMKQIGLEYTFAYCWGIPNSPTPPQAIAAQMDFIHKTQALNIIPQVVTVSQAWSGWQDENTIWKIPPKEYEGLLRQAKDFIGTLPKDQLGSKMMLLDNWNEWGEGHYIAPYREYGFGYLDAVRKVFSDAPEAHTDVIPEDIGMGPYDTAYKAHMKK